MQIAQPQLNFIKIPTLVTPPTLRGDTTPFCSCARLFDRNGDGQLDAPELSRAFDLMGVPMTDDEIKVSASCARRPPVRGASCA